MKFDFGDIIAYIVPGAIVIAPIVIYIHGLKGLFLLNIAEITIYILISLFIGIVISSIRYILFDKIIFKKICVELDWNILNIEKYKVANSVRYRYYQFYSNSFVAQIISLILIIKFQFCIWWLIILFILVSLIFLYSSYDCCKRYYDHFNEKEKK